MLRLSWSQPEDLLPHAIVAARLDGCDVAGIERRWIAAGGNPVPPVSGASPTAAPEVLRTLARALLDEVDAASAPASLVAAEPDDLGAIEALTPGAALRSPADDDIDDRLLGGWLGRAAGCLLGKPVEKVPRAGILAIARSTGNWPIVSYFTARGLDPEVAAAHPWNRRSAANSLVENIDGMPEDDDMNFALIALRLVELHGASLTADDVAAMWLDELPGGRVFTAERVTYRNLLAGARADAAGGIGNPFQAWIGAQIRTDVYGWVSPGDPQRAARLAWEDARLSHRRSGIYGAMFVAAASAAAVVGTSVDECIEGGLSVVPPDSRYARAIGRGVELARSSMSDDRAIDALYDDYGHLHWVHVLNNSALLAFALTRSGGDFTTAITTAVAGGWDTDSTGATVGALCGALTGAAALPAPWVDPLRNRLSSSVGGFANLDDGRIGFDELARRVAAARLPVRRGT